MAADRLVYAVACVRHPLHHLRPARVHVDRQGRGGGQGPRGAGAHRRLALHLHHRRPVLHRSLLLPPLQVLHQVISKQKRSV